VHTVNAVIRFLVYGSLALALCLGAGIVYYMTWEPDRKRYPIRGIDVSHHNGNIDWQAVAASDVAFAYIKASEGGDFIDPAFDRNASAARMAQVPVGAYHFFSFCKDADEQAGNFLTVTGSEVLVLPPVLDLELQGNCARRPERQAVEAAVRQWISLVARATGKTPILYVSEAFLRHYPEVTNGRLLWVRSILQPPDYASNWSVWQYHDRGEVSGISGAVDLNVLAEGVTLNTLMENG